MTRAEVLVRAARSEDLPAVAALLDRTFGPRPYEQRLRLWRWRSDENPARVPEIPGFLVAELEGKIVGAHGLAPMRVKLPDRVVVASCSCDLAVDPRARSAGMKIKLRALSREVSALHISTSANEPANRITLALGGKEIAHGRRKMLKPLKASGLLARPLESGPGWLSRAARSSLTLADWPLALGRLLSRLPRSAGAEVRTITRFDGRFDRFWSALSGRYPILAVRDAPYLNWRYQEYPFPGITSLGLYRGDQLLGFAAIHLARDEDGLPFVALLDLLAAADEREAYGHLLGTVIERSVVASAHYIAARASDPRDEAVLGRFGFRARVMDFSPATYKSNTDHHSSLFADNRNWFLALGDGDGCYYFE